MDADEKKTHTDGLSEGEFAELLQAVSTMAPLLKGFLQPKSEPQEKNDAPQHPVNRRRDALLLAMKPYLSQGRSEAVDYLVRLARVGDAIRALK
ncbi:MAG: hypothetical protein E7585_03835 [Ruminococcaceae bacterium]|nr:hypothetical protein [Oscillospiraceae bacterium]